MDESILTSIKRLLGIEEEYTHFDPEIMIHINSVFSTLHQLGVGPQTKAFMITGKDETWGQFKGAEDRIEAVKSYIYLRVRLLFDPPNSGFVTTSFENQIKELEWRLNVAVDPGLDASQFADTDILQILYTNAVRNGYTGTYEEWLEKFNGQGGTGANLKDDLTATIGAGGIKIGDQFFKGDELEKLWRSLLNPVAYPTIIEPSVLLVPSGSMVMETGSSKTVTMIIKPNFGSIIPAYGTSGKRAGDIIGYKLNGSEVSGDTIAVAVDENNRIFGCSVIFGPGEQPLDSVGNDFNAPYPGGEASSPIVSYEFVDCLWSNADDNSVVAKEPVISKSAKSRQFIFAPQTATSPEIFDVPASWNVTKIEVLNEITERFEDNAKEFTVSDTIHPNAAGVDVAYKRYTDNRGYNAGERTIKITWS